MRLTPAQNNIIDLLEKGHRIWAAAGAGTRISCPAQCSKSGVRVSQASINSLIKCGKVRRAPGSLEIVLV